MNPALGALLPLYIFSPYIEGFVRLATASEAGLVSAGDIKEPVLGIRRRLEESLPVAQVEVGDHLLLKLLLNHLFDRRDHGGGGWQVGLGLVEPALNTVADGDLFLRRSQSWEDGEQLDEAHDAERPGRTTTR